MKNMGLKEQLASSLKVIIRYHVYLISAVLLAVFIKVSFDLRHVSNPPENEELYQEKYQQLESARIQFNEDIIKQIQDRTLTGADVNPRNTGNPNPFD